MQNEAIEKMEAKGMNICYFSTPSGNSPRVQGENGAIKVLLYAKQSDGTITPVLVDADGKIVTTATP